MGEEEASPTAGRLGLAGGCVVARQSRHSASAGGRTASPDARRHRAGDVLRHRALGLGISPSISFALPIILWFAVGGSREARSDSQLSDRREQWKHCSLINYIVPLEEMKRRARRFLIGRLK